MPTSNKHSDRGDQQHSGLHQEDHYQQIEGSYLLFLPNTVEAMVVEMTEGLKHLI